MACIMDATEHIIRGILPHKSTQAPMIALNVLHTRMNKDMSCGPTRQTMQTTMYRIILLLDLLFQESYLATHLICP
jgi:hypothetical protein